MAAGMEQLPAQQNLFGESLEELPVVRAALPTEEVVRTAARMPKNLHFGTSSWTFPGWAGIVYHDVYAASALARYGLHAYAKHPLLSMVSLDSTFYRPAPVEQLARYAAQVPDHFRFLVKAYSGLTTAPESTRGSGTGESVFLDPDFATRAVIRPLVEGLGSKLAVVLFQFSPLGAVHTRAPGSFARRLEAFLGALPVGPQYAVELRDAQILGSQYERALEATGAVHCRSVHSRMPPVDEQVTDSGKGPLIIRWMLRPGDDYESAGARYAPFHRLVQPDELSRSRIAGMVRPWLVPGLSGALSAERDMHIVAANNAEGSAPATLLELAKVLAFRDLNSVEPFRVSGSGRGGAPRDC